MQLFIKYHQFSYRKLYIFSVWTDFNKFNMHDKLHKTLPRIKINRSVLKFSGSFENKWFYRFCCAFLEFLLCYLVSLPRYTKNGVEKPSHFTRKKSTYKNKLEKMFDNLYPEHFFSINKIVPLYEGRKV